MRTEVNIEEPSAESEIKKITTKTNTLTENKQTNQRVKSFKCIKYNIC
jgi:hypothetical protein